jgi:hypothetical protein
MPQPTSKYTLTRKHIVMKASATGAGVCFFRSGNSFRLLLILIHSSERTGAPALMRSND